MLHATGVALGSTWMLIGGPGICGIGWWGQLLNVEEAYLSSRYCFIFVMFSGTAGNGSLLGSPGGGVRFGQVQGSSADSCTASTSAAAPTQGKFGGTIRSYFIASFDR